MAWHCSGTTNEEMVAKLKEANIIGNERVKAAMSAVNRANYCHDSDPYEDCPKKIGFNVTISAPHMHAYALSFLTNQLFEGAKALDVGSGSGYLTACMAHMVGPQGLVVGVEHIPELIKLSIENVKKDNPQFLENGRMKFLGILFPNEKLGSQGMQIIMSEKSRKQKVIISFYVEGDGRLGVATHGPYNAIHVGAAAESMPQELVDQLAPGGRLICPVVAVEGFNRYQHLLQIDKNSDGTVKKQKLMDVSYVLLTDTNTQLHK